MKKLRSAVKAQYTKLIFVKSGNTQKQYENYFSNIIINTIQENILLQIKKVCSKNIAWKMKFAKLKIESISRDDKETITLSTSL